MHSLQVPRAPYAQEGPSLLEVLALEELAPDRFQANATYENGWRLYGGQVAAQALIAAGRTVPDGRPPHSMHAYFLRMGSPAERVEFRVERDRDGRSFSARRVSAHQRGEVILTLSASFTVPDDGTSEDEQVLSPPVVEPPGMPGRPMVLIDFEQSIPSQRHPMHSYPTRHWVRCTAPLPDDPLLDAAVITYLSDLCTGHDELPSSAHRAQATLDHTLWFHRAASPLQWLLVDLHTRGVKAGRGVYSGGIWTEDGTLVASLAQESLYRERRS